MHEKGQSTVTNSWFPRNTSQRLTHRGRTLGENETLFDAGICAGALLELLPRICGGGGDGGSTGAESRSAYLEMYQGKKPDKVNPEEERLARWTTCRLSGMPLNPPCVMDELGNLYNKEAIVQALLAKAIPPGIGYLTGLKSLIDLKLEEAKDTSSTGAVRFACPVTGIPMNGKARFVAVRPGNRSPAYVLSERAVKELREVAMEVVGGAWMPEDVLQVLPQGGELEALQTALAARREAALVAKASKKAAKEASKAKESRGKRSAGALSNATEQNNGEKQADVEVHKKVRSVAPPPTHADPQVWNSLFLKKNPEDGNDTGKQKKNGVTTDYMVRGALKYVA